MTGMLDNTDYGYATSDYSTPGSVQHFDTTVSGNKSTVVDCIEMWDYVGGIRFRGFVAEQEGEKAMFVFFDQAVLQSSSDMKSG